MTRFDQAADATHLASISFPYESNLITGAVVGIILKLIPMSTRLKRAQPCRRNDCSRNCDLRTEVLRSQAAQRRFTRAAKCDGVAALDEYGQKRNDFQTRVDEVYGGRIRQARQRQNGRTRPKRATAPHSIGQACSSFGRRQVTGTGSEFFSRPAGKKE